MPINLQTLVSGVPNVKGPIHLVAFLFSVACLTLLAKVDPNNIQALSVSSALAVSIIALPLLLHPPMLRLIPIGQRYKYILSILALLLISVLGLGYYTFKVAIDPPPRNSKFDVGMVSESAQLLKHENGTARLVGRLQFKSQEPVSGTGATIFSGMVVVHDESKLGDAGLGDVVDATCAETESCLGAFVFKQFEANPLLIRAGAMNAEASFGVDLKSSAERLRVWWIFFQRESGKDLECRFNNRRSAMREGIAPLASFHVRSGEIVLDHCFGAQDFAVLTI